MRIHSSELLSVFENPKKIETRFKQYITYWEKEHQIFQFDIEHLIIVDDLNFYLSTSNFVNTDFKFQNIYFEGDVIINSSKCKLLDLSHCIFHNTKLEFNGGDFEEVVLWENEIKDLIFEDVVRIDTLTIHCDYIENILFKKGRFNRVFCSITHSDLVSLKKQSSLCIDFFDYQSRGSSNLNIECSINTISVSGEFNSSSKITISQISNWVLNLVDMKCHGELILNDITVGKSEDYNFTQLKDSQLNIIKTDLKHSQWVNFRVQDYDLIRIEETSLNSVIFPLSIVKTVDDRENDNYGLYKLYNFLYQYFKQNSDAKSEVEFYRYSRKALLEYYCEKRIWQHIPSKISLYVSSLFSNYGSNWLKSVLITSLISLTLYFFMVFTILGFGFLKYDYVILENFFVFLNPTHKLTFLDNKIEGITFSTKFIFVISDFIGRIFVGIGIYETIRSFRRYAR